MDKKLNDNNVEMIKSPNKVVRFLLKFLRYMGKDNISAYSAQCAYYTILSFIPFSILLLTLIQYINVDQETLFNIISKIIPNNLNGFVMEIIKEVYSKSIGTISISILFILWSADNGQYALIKGLYDIYKVDGEKTKNFLSLKLSSIFRTIIFIIVLVIALALLVFGNSLISIVKNNFGMFQNYTIISRILTEIAYLIAIFLIFLILYKFTPNTKNKLKKQMPGAIFGSITLNIVSFIFSRFLDIFKGFSVMYGSLTTLMLVMMWTYSVFYIIFLGAELNKVIK